MAKVPAHSRTAAPSLLLGLWALLLALPARAQEAIVPPTINCTQPPRYPDSERASWIEGAVLTRVSLDATGKITNIEIVQSLGPAFDEATTEAVRSCAFTPATQGGQPITVTVEMNVGFTPPPARLSGLVTNERGEPLAFATVHAGDAGAETSAEGRFSFDLPAQQEVTVIVYRDGFGQRSTTVPLIPGDARELSFKLSEEKKFEATVQTNRWLPPPPTPDKTPTTSHYTITKADLDRTPGAMEDITRVVATMPGVVADPDLLATFFVRGGGPDEVVFYLDDVPLSNPYHLGGFTSTFNPMLIDSADFWSGGTPARYEPALSGVLDIHYSASDPPRPKLNFDVSMQTAKLRFDTPTPIKGLTATFAARRSYFELYFAGLRAFGVVGQNYAAPDIGEYFGRLNYRRGRHHLIATYLRATDGLAFRIKPGEQVFVNFAGGLTLDNTTQIGILQDRIDLGANRELRLTAALTNDANLTSVSSTTIFSRDTNRFESMLRADLTLPTSERNKLLTGVQFSRRRYDFDGQITDARADAPWNSRPIVDTNNAMLDINPSSLRQIYAAYIEDQFRPIAPLAFEVGLRLQHEMQTGQTNYSTRLGVSYNLPTQGVVKLSGGIATQLPLNPLLLDPTYGNPKLSPERSRQLILGLEQPLPFEAMIRIEGWAKWLDHLAVNPDSREGLQQLLARGEPAFQSVGSGFARGADVMLLGRTKRSSYGLSAGLVFSDRTNPLATGAKTYAAPWDQRLTISANYSVIPKPDWMVTLRGTVHSGRPYTPIIGFVGDSASQKYLPVFGETNGARYPWFYELSARVQKRFAFRDIPLMWYAELLNVTNAQNVFMYIYDNGNYANGTAPSSGTFNHLPVRPFLGVSGEY